MYANIVNFDLNNPVNEFVKNHHLFKFVNIYGWDEIKLVDKNLPTLYIGYENCRNIFSNIEISNNVISQTEFWSFTPKESLIYYIEQISEFFRNIPSTLVKLLTAEVIEPFFSNKYKTVADIRRRIDLFNPSVAYVHNKVISLSNSSKSILLINCAIWEAFFVTRESLVNFLSDKETIKIIVDHDEKVYAFFIDKFNYNGGDINLYAPYLINLKLQHN